MPSMSNVTVDKNEYNLLKSKANAYNKIAALFALTAVNKPVKEVVANFEKTGKYSTAFLKDLKDGLTDLRRSKQWKS